MKITMKMRKNKIKRTKKLRKQKKRDQYEKQLLNEGNQKGKERKIQK